MLLCDKQRNGETSAAAPIMPSAWLSVSRWLFIVLSGKILQTYKHVRTDKRSHTTRKKRVKAVVPPHHIPQPFQRGAPLRYAGAPPLALQLLWRPRLWLDIFSLPTLRSLLRSARSACFHGAARTAGGGASKCSIQWHLANARATLTPHRQTQHAAGATERQCAAAGDPRATAGMRGTSGARGRLLLPTCHPFELFLGDTALLVQ